MVRYKVRSWCDKDELQQVRTKLFLPNTAENVTARRDACDTVEIWSRRLPLSHAISSTRLLVEAQLHQLTSPESSNAVTCAILATAVARFVTGFCDINQSSSVKRSMFEVAADLGIPEDWVELRHQTTHGGELPPLLVLVSAAGGALNWLWKMFWVKLDASGDTEQSVQELGIEDQAASAQHRLEMRAYLKSYVSARKIEVQRSAPQQVDQSSKAAEEAATKIHTAWEDWDDTNECLLSLLVDDEMAIPSKRVIGSSMSGAFALWDSLLFMLSLRIPGFLPSLVLRWLTVLTEDSNQHEHQDASKEACTLWLEHIFTSSAWSWRRKRSQDHLAELKSEALQLCSLSPGLWTQTLARAVIRNGDPELRAAWHDIFDAAALGDEHTDQSPEAILTTRGEVADKYGEITDMSDTHNSKEFSGWRVFPGLWQNVPIGASSLE